MRSLDWICERFQVSEAASEALVMFAVIKLKSHQHTRCVRNGSQTVPCPALVAPRVFDSKEKSLNRGIESYLTDNIRQHKDERFKGLIFLLSRPQLFIIMTHVIFCLPPGLICWIESVLLMKNLVSSLLFISFFVLLMQVYREKNNSTEHVVQTNSHQKQMNPCTVAMVWNPWAACAVAWIETNYISFNIVSTLLTLLYISFSTVFKGNASACKAEKEWLWFSFVLCFCINWMPLFCCNGTQSTSCFQLAANTKNTSLCCEILWNKNKPLNHVGLLLIHFQNCKRCMLILVFGHHMLVDGCYGVAMGVVRHS